MSGLTDLADRLLVKEIVAVHGYPVKSMGGELLPQAHGWFVVGE